MDVSTLTDAQLVAEVTRLAGRERRATVDLLRSLIEFDVRRLYLGQGFPSLYAYCTEVLNYSGFAAFNRIEVARAAKRFPQLLEEIAEGALHLSGARVLAPHLTADNCERVLASARYKSKRGIEEIVLALASPSELPPERIRLHLSVSRTTHDKLRRAQDLMRHSLPDGDPAEIFDRALTLLLTELERKRFGAITSSRPPRAAAETSRYIPKAVKRHVQARDGGRCAFVGVKGRCRERGFLEFHHVVPFAAGGKATVGNIELRCRAHNAHEAAVYFGPLNPRRVPPAIGGDSGLRTLPGP